MNWSHRHPQHRWMHLMSLCSWTLLVWSTSRLRGAEPARKETSPTTKPITWTEVSTVDQQDPTLQRGIVYGPDGQPLAGAKVYAASHIELFTLRKAEQLTTADLGVVRAVTDELGRFEFHTPDLTWTPAAGEQKRWEALLVATQEGLCPGWIATWGQDRTLRSHWHPYVSKKVEIHLARPTALRGRFVGPDGLPVDGALVRLTALRMPSRSDLDQHLESLRKMQPFDNGPGYVDSFHRPQILPDIPDETHTDADGNFALPGLPGDRIAELEVTHPNTQTATVTVAIRDMEPIYMQPGEFVKEPRLLLYGSGFTHKLAQGFTIRGRVVDSVFLGERRPLAGVTIAEANHNSSTGIQGPSFITDAEGKFEITGLGPDYYEPGYEVAVIGSYAAPVAPQRYTLRADREEEVETQLAVPYRLKLVDAAGQPIDREVYSIDVQPLPDQIWRRATSVFNRAVRVAPGVYEGLTPYTPGAVLVSRGDYRDRPAFVDPKAYFEPRRTDWTLEEERYAYGTPWEIIQPGIITTERLAPSTNQAHSQLELAAVVFTNPGREKIPLELTAVVHQDQPPEVTLVDEAGQPVEGVRVARQLKRYNEKGLPSKFPLYGLHPERAEQIQFHHDERDLIGYIRATLTNEPIRVVMKPAATIRGRIATRDGQPTSEFGAMVSGAVLPDTMFANRVFGGEASDRGRFEFQVVPDETYTGELVRRIGSGFAHLTRPTIGRAFGPVTPHPGDTIDLGDIVTP